MAVINQRSLIEVISGPPAAPTAPEITGPTTVLASAIAGQFAMAFTGTAPITWAINPPVSGVSVSAGVVSYPANFSDAITVTATNSLGVASKTVTVSQPAVVSILVLDPALDAAVRSATTKTAQLQAIISRVPTKAIFSGVGVALCEHVISSTTQSSGKLVIAFGAVTGIANGTIDKMTIYAGATALLECSLSVTNAYQISPAGMKVAIETTHSIKASAGLPA
jgi:hypothetical protein